MFCGGLSQGTVDRIPCAAQVFSQAIRAQGTLNLAAACPRSQQSKGVSE